MSQINAAKIAKSSLWLSASYIFTRLFKFVTQLFLARLLLPNDFGIWGMVLLVTALATLFEDSTIAGVLVYRGLEDKKLVDAVYSLGINVSVGLCLIQAITAFPVALFFDTSILGPLLLCTSIVYLIRAGAGSHGAVLQRQMKFSELAICDVAASFSYLVSVIACAELGGGVWSFAAGEITSAIVSSALKHWYSRYPFTYHFIPDVAAVRETRGYISSLISINLAVYVNTSGDNFIVGKLSGAQALGYYNLAYQLAMLPGFVLSRINGINFSVLSQQDNESQKYYVCQTLELYALIAAPIYGIGFVIAPWLIPLAYGSNWIEVVPLFQIVLIFAYARIFMAVLGTALNALNQPNVNAAINWVLVPIALPAFWLGAWLNGVTGVSISVVLVMGVGATIWFWQATCRIAGWPLGVLLKPVFLPTVIGLLSTGIVVLAPIPNPFKNFLQPVGLVLIYVVALSVISSGRIPRKLIALLRKSLSR